MELNIQTAELALREAAESNPGAWAEHSRYVAEACKNIASHCKDLSSEQAYIFGLLHDIGRYAGVSSERHLIDRWKKILEIKERFEDQIGCSIYALLPGVMENSFR